MTPARLSDLVFGSEQANHNFSRILGDLKRANLSITNRLRSIKHDAEFVARVAASWSLPLVANERCGLWYIEPQRKAAHAYFKSTDGHTGQWSFSTRRLNLHLLDVLGRHDGLVGSPTRECSCKPVQQVGLGRVYPVMMADDKLPRYSCIIVDSTRRGKSMPDALSKTVPIWCCVVNRVLFLGDEAAGELVLPSSAVSDSEKSQIEARIPDFVAALKQLHLDWSSLKRHISKPLRPTWTTQNEAVQRPVMFKDFHTIVCCTSSRRVVGTEMSEAGYIQGAGDDTENWALGLTASIFWRHVDELLSTPEAAIPELVASLVASDSVPDAGDNAGTKQLSPLLSVGTLSLGATSVPEGHCVISLMPRVTGQGLWANSRTRLEVGLGKAKVASRTLRNALPVICDFVWQYVKAHTAGSESLPPPHVVVLCESGKDLCVGVALAISCWALDDDGQLRVSENKVEFTKSRIRVRLGRIMTAMPEANPCRATLQSVHSFLMDWRI